MMNRPRHGVSLVYGMIIMTAMIAITSLAVDLGRVQLAKTEMRRAATAAVRAAAASMSTSLANVQSMAQQYAQYNTIDGGTIAFTPSTDVAVGSYNSTTKTFTPGTFATATAVQVTLRRTAATSNAIPLTFARVIGRSSFDITVSAIATASTSAPVSSNPAPGFFGLSAFSTSGISTDSYSATAGTYASQTPGNKGSIGSNSDVYAWSDTISGDARPGTGHIVYGGAISGSTTPLPSAVSYTAAATPSGNNNANIVISGGSLSSGDLSIYGTATLPAGTYVFGNISCSGTLIFTGPASVYCTGQVSLSGNITTYQNKPGNLLLVAGTGLYLYFSQPLYADIFSPNAQVSMSPTADFYGQIIAQSCYIYNMHLHHDTSLTTHSPTGGGFTSGSGSGGGSGTTTISLVQ